MRKKQETLVAASKLRLMYVCAELGPTGPRSLDLRLHYRNEKWYISGATPSFREVCCMGRINGDLTRLQLILPASFLTCHAAECRESTNTDVLYSSDSRNKALRKISRTPFFAIRKSAA